MLTRCMLLSAFLWMITCSTGRVHAAEDVTVYTANTKISVPPGESIDYSIDLINNSDEVKKLDFRLIGIPSSWDYTLKSGGYSIRQMSVLPGKTKSVTLKVDVPLMVNKGNYFLTLNADDYKLPLVINVSKQGSNKTEFTTEQANMQGHSKSNFTFNTEITNRTGSKQLYALQSRAPRGWKVIFKPNYKQATSVEIEANESKNVSVEVTPPYMIKAGNYKIPVKAVAGLSSADLELEVVVSGTYEMELSTPSGLLSSKLTAGEEQKIELLVRNTGSAELKDVKLSASKPTSWEVEFDPETIETIAPGKNASVKAIITAGKKAIAGDYVVNLKARTPEVNADQSFRLLVKTPMIWGWVGVVIILSALGSIVFLFRKYGRR